MRYAIIAAGEGSRLAQEGVKEPKPLVRVGNERLIDRLLRIFMDNNAEEIVVICNDITSLVSRHLEEIRQQGIGGRRVPLRYIVKSTPSSLHSFYELSPYLQDDKFCLTTVDTIFREEEFSTFIETFKQSETDGYMAVTDFIDDEKPLYISTDSALDMNL